MPCADVILLVVMGLALPPFGCEPCRSSSVQCQASAHACWHGFLLKFPCCKTLIVFSTCLPQALAVAAENAATLHAHTLARKVPDLNLFSSMFCFYNPDCVTIKAESTALLLCVCVHMSCLSSVVCSGCSARHCSFACLCVAGCPPPRA